MTMSKQATSALINSLSGRQGTVVISDMATIWELQDLELIGPDYGLTRKGTIARERAMRAAEDAAFGA